MRVSFSPSENDYFSRMNYLVSLYFLTKEKSEVKNPALQKFQDVFN